MVDSAEPSCRHRLRSPSYEIFRSNRSPKPLHARTKGARRAAKERLRIARERHRCQVPGCCKPVKNISRYCSKHLRAYQRTGHPQGRTIRAAEVKPYRKRLKPYLTEGGLDGLPPDLRDRVTKSIACLDQWLFQANRPHTSIHPGSPPAQRVSAWLTFLAAEGITGAEIFSVLAAVQTLFEERPGLALSRRYEAYARVTRVLRLRRGLPVTGNPHASRPVLPAEATLYFDKVLVERCGVASLLLARHMLSLDDDHQSV